MRTFVVPCSDPPGFQVCAPDTHQFGWMSKSDALPVDSSRAYKSITCLIQSRPLVGKIPTCWPERYATPEAAVRRARAIQLGRMGAGEVSSCAHYLSRLEGHVL